MSFVIDQFEDANKWAEIRIGTGVVADRKTTSFKATVNNIDDKAGLVTFDAYDLSSCDIRALADRATAKTILLIRRVKDLADPMPDEREYLYALIRDHAYGVQVFDGFGYPYFGSDPVNSSETAELRITISEGVIYFYYAGVLIYSESLRFPATSLYVYLMSYATSYGTTIAGTNTFTSTGYVPPQYNLTIQSTIGGTLNPTEGTHGYDIGTNVPVTATVTPGYILDHWELDGVNIGNVNPTTVTMNADHTLLAVFVAIQTHTLTVDSTPIQGIPFTIERVS